MSTEIAATLRTSIAGASPVSPRTEFFDLDESVDGFVTPRGGPECDNALARERCELEATKVNFKISVQRQHLREQSISSLLKRLEQLPSPRSKAQTSVEPACQVSADVAPQTRDTSEERVPSTPEEQEPQLRSAVSRLLKAGVDVHRLTTSNAYTLDDEASTVSPSPGEPETSDEPSLDDELDCAVPGDDDSVEAPDEPTFAPIGHRVAPPTCLDAAADQALDQAAQHGKHAHALGDVRRPPALDAASFLSPNNAIATDGLPQFTDQLLAAGLVSEEINSSFEKTDAAAAEDQQSTPHQRLLLPESDSQWPSPQQNSSLASNSDATSSQNAAPTPAAVNTALVAAAHRSLQTAASPQASPQKWIPGSNWAPDVSKALLFDEQDEDEIKEFFTPRLPESDAAAGGAASSPPSITNPSVDPDLHQPPSESSPRYNDYEGYDKWNQQPVDCQAEPMSPNARVESATTSTPVAASPVGASQELRATMVATTTTATTAAARLQPANEPLVAAAAVPGQEPGSESWVPAHHCQQRTRQAALRPAPERSPEPPSPRLQHRERASEVVEDVWRGWSMRTTCDGNLFYHHATSGISQWQRPAELTHIMGDWTRHRDAEGNLYWQNLVLGESSWADPRNTTNVLHAALDGDVFFARLYAAAGGSFAVSDAEGRTALHLACASGSEAMVDFLLDSGVASLDAVDNAGMTPLHWACKYIRTDMVRTLLQAKADPNALNALGDSPAHEAAAMGYTEPVRWLVASRANVACANGRGLTPLDIATQCGHVDVAEMLQHREHFASRPRRGRRHRSSVEAQESDASAIVYDALQTQESYPLSPMSPMSPMSPSSPISPVSPRPSAYWQLAGGQATGGYAAVQRAEQRESMGFYDIDTEQGPQSSIGFGLQHSSEGVGSPSTPMSPVMKVIRAARPVLRGVQWLASRMLPERCLEQELHEVQAQAQAYAQAQAEAQHSRPMMEMPSENHSPWNAYEDMDVYFEMGRRRRDLRMKLARVD